MSSSVIAFNKISIDGLVISDSEFVSGSGSLSIRGNDRNVVTADGVIHHFRISRSAGVSFRVYGDKSSLSSPLGEAVAVNVYRDDSLIHSFQGIVTINYSSDPALSSVSISGNPEF